MFITSLDNIKCILSALNKNRVKGLKEFIIQSYLNASF